MCDRRCMITHAEFPDWPDGADVAVALTFDVDGETPWRGEGPEYGRRLTVLSQGRFGPERGLGRVLALLAEQQIPGTSYIHGYTHLGTEGLDEAAQRAELERGLAAFERHGIRPIGYRSPGWELTPETLGMLPEYGMRYES